MTIATTNLAAAVEAWTAYQAHAGSIKYPETEAECLALLALALADNLTSRHSLTEEPYGALFDAITAYLVQWQSAHPDDLGPELTPVETLEVLMQERRLTQKQLSQDLGTSRSTLSRILRGQRHVSRDLAEKLAAYFGRSRTNFL